MRVFDKDFFIFSGVIMILLGLFISSAKGKEPVIIVKEQYDLYSLVERLADPYDFSDTIKVLIYNESRDGLYPINLNDPACGVTHININTYVRRHKLKNTPFNRNKACSDLINSPEWAILNAIEELEFWKKIHCKGGKECTSAQYTNVIKSYNAGWNYKGQKAKEYWEKFKETYKLLKKRGAFGNKDIQKNDKNAKKVKQNKVKN